MALLEGSLLALAKANDAGHVDLVDGVDMRAGADALGHALGDDGAHFGLGTRSPVSGGGGGTAVRQRLRPGL